MMVKNTIVTCSGLLLLLLGLAGGFECNNLKKFRCKKGGKAKVNGCTWKKDALKQYRHFPLKKKLFGICLNAGQSESQVFGTPAERCDCGTKCMRKCTTKRGYKDKCYWASRDGNPRSRAGTCLPNRHFGGGCVAVPNATALDDDNIETAVFDWLNDKPTACTTYGDIRGWNISEVTNLEELFANEGSDIFNSDLSNWDTSKVTNMESTFENAGVFNGDLSKWDTSKVTSMKYMFRGREVVTGGPGRLLLGFDPLGGFDPNPPPPKSTSFNGDLSKWDTGNVVDFKGMFRDCSYFNSDLSKWDTSKATYMGSMFRGNDGGSMMAFDTTISTWDTSKITSFRSMFMDNLNFNSDISTWNTSEVTQMESMFENAKAFNKLYNDKWTTSKVSTMQFMFKNAIAFNADISKWDIGNVNAAANNGESSKEDTFSGATALLQIHYPSGW